MRRLKAGTAGIAVAALALTLAACGNESSDNDNDKSPAGGDNELSAELTWWDTSDAANEAPAYDKLIEKFNEDYPNVTIKHETVPFDQTQTKFKTAAESGSGAPDILRAEVAWVPEFASLGYLYALDGTAALENNFLETPLSSNVFDGKTYGVPQVTDTLGLMYNKALFEKAGIDAPPTTWDEVKTAAEALKSKAGVDGIYINSGGYFLLPFLYGEGADLVDTEAQEIVVNSQEAVTGIQTAQDLVKSGAAVKPVANDPYGTMMTLFKEQKV
ncbi:MAG: extracellular solute-binding protein, partial [Nocardioides sp.]|nr:extracellular solute-binding protein [Nocardioides sp.]